MFFEKCQDKNPHSYSIADLRFRPRKPGSEMLPLRSSNGSPEKDMQLLWNEAEVTYSSLPVAYLSNTTHSFGWMDYQREHLFN